MTSLLHDSLTLECPTRIPHKSYHQEKETSEFTKVNSAETVIMLLLAVEVVAVLLSVSSFLPVLSIALLTCDPESLTCPDSYSLVSCECQGSNIIRWRVILSTGSEVYSSTCSSDSDAVIANSMNGVTGVLCNITDGPVIRGFPTTIIASKLNVTLSENVTVECTDSGGTTGTVLLQKASKFIHDKQVHLKGRE